MEDVYTQRQLHWIDELPRLVSDYNARKHRTISIRPADVTPAIAERLLDMMYSAIRIAGPSKFKVGLGGFGTRERSKLY